MSTFTLIVFLISLLVGFITIILWVIQALRKKDTRKFKQILAYVGVAIVLSIVLNIFFGEDPEEELVHGEPEIHEVVEDDDSEVNEVSEEEETEEVDQDLEDDEEDDKEIDLFDEEDTGYTEEEIELFSGEEFDFKEAMRRPEQYAKKDVEYEIRGTVVQTIDDPLFPYVRLALNGNMDEIILVQYDDSNLSYNILEDDEVVFYARFDGMESYKTVLGDTRDIPKLFAYFTSLVED